MKYLICTVLVTSFLICNAQTLKRWPNGKVEITDKTMKFERHKSIFDEYSWTYPDIKSTRINFTNGQSTFKLGGQNYTLTQEGDKKMKLLASGNETTSQEELSNGKIYFDKTALKLKAVTVQKWTSYTVMTTKQVSVQKSRMVTSYSYSNGKSTPVYRTEYYTAYEGRPVSETKWHYVPQTTYVIDIPKYKYYNFVLNDNINLLLYKTEQGQYYIQNSAFLTAKDEAGINHIFIDADSDGSFLGSADRVMFNSWDPYSPGSAYKSAGAYRDNKWYNLSELNHNNFLSFEQNEQTQEVIIAYENSRYVDEDDKGKVVFTNLPKDARLSVNGKEYRIRKEEAKFKSQYGKFLVRISQRGYTDFEEIYTVSADAPQVNIDYKPTLPAGNLRIINIFEPSYSVIVANQSGYTQSYNNQASFAVPNGKSTISIFSNGFSLNHDIEVINGADVQLDFEDEVSKLKEENKVKAAPAAPAIDSINKVTEPK